MLKPRPHLRRFDRRKLFIAEGRRQVDTTIAFRETEIVFIGYQYRPRPTVLCNNHRLTYSRILLGTKILGHGSGRDCGCHSDHLFSVIYGISGFFELRSDADCFSHSAATGSVTKLGRPRRLQVRRLAMMRSVQYRKFQRSAAPILPFDRPVSAERHAHPSTHGIAAFQAARPKAGERRENVNGYWLADCRVKAHKFARRRTPF